MRFGEDASRMADASVELGRVFLGVTVVEMDRKMLDLNAHEAAEPLQRHPRMNEWLDSELATLGNGQSHS